MLNSGLLVFLFFVIFNNAYVLAVPTGNNTCTGIKKVPVTVLVNVTEPVTFRTYEWCLRVPPRCSKYVVQLKERAKIQKEIHNKTITLCCKGYVEMYGKCLPACPQHQQCSNMHCNSTNHCYCTPGYAGLFCKEPCPKGTWGTDCTKGCDCPWGYTCHHLTGDCMLDDTPRETTLDVSPTTALTPQSSSPTSKLFNYHFKQKFRPPTRKSSAASTTSTTPTVPTSTSKSENFFDLTSILQDLTEFANNLQNKKLPSTVSISNGNSSQKYPTAATLLSNPVRLISTTYLPISVYPRPTQFNVIKLTDDVDMHRIQSTEEPIKVQKYNREFEQNGPEGTSDTTTVKISSQKVDKKKLLKKEPIDYKSNKVVETSYLNKFDLYTSRPILKETYSEKLYKQFLEQLNKNNTVLKGNENMSENKMKENDEDLSQNNISSTTVSFKSELNVDDKTNNVSVTSLDNTDIHNIQNKKKEFIFGTPSAHSKFNTEMTTNRNFVSTRKEFKKPLKTLNIIYGKGVREKMEEIIPKQKLTTEYLKKSDSITESTNYLTFNNHSTSKVHNYGKMFDVSEASLNEFDGISKPIKIINYNVEKFNSEDNNKIKNNVVLQKLNKTNNISDSILSSTSTISNEEVATEKNTLESLLNDLEKLSEMFTESVSPSNSNSLSKDAYPNVLLNRELRPSFNEDQQSKSLDSQYSKSMLKNINNESSTADIKNEASVIQYMSRRTYNPTTINWLLETNPIITESNEDQLKSEISSKESVKYTSESEERHFNTEKYDSILGNKKAVVSDEIIPKVNEETATSPHYTIKITEPVDNFYDFKSKMLNKDIRTTTSDWKNSNFNEYSNNEESVSDNEGTKREQLNESKYINEFHPYHELYTSKINETEKTTYTPTNIRIYSKNTVQSNSDVFKTGDKENYKEINEKVTSAPPNKDLFKKNDSNFQGRFFKEASSTESLVTKVFQDVSTTEGNIKMNISFNQVHENTDQSSPSISTPNLMKENLNYLNEDEVTTSIKLETISTSTLNPLLNYDFLVETNSKKDELTTSFSTSEILSKNPFKKDFAVEPTKSQIYNKYNAISSLKPYKLSETSNNNNNFSIKQLNQSNLFNNIVRSTQFNFDVETQTAKLTNDINFPKKNTEEKIGGSARSQHSNIEIPNVTKKTQNIDFKNFDISHTNFSKSENAEKIINHSSQLTQNLTNSVITNTFIKQGVPAVTNNFNEIETTTLETNIMDGIENMLLMEKLENEEIDLPMEIKNSSLVGLLIGCAGLIALWTIFIYIRKKKQNRCNQYYNAPRIIRAYDESAIIHG